MVKWIKLIAISWLFFLVSFYWGVYVYETKRWPYPIIQEIKRFVAGHEVEKTSSAQKMLNDHGAKPFRHLVSENVKTPVSGRHRPLRGLPLKPRRQNPMIFISEDAPKGYRVIYGVFDFIETLCGAIMLDDKGNVAHVWEVSQKDVNWKHRPDTNIYPHGFEIAPDGCILVDYDYGSSLTKYDYCNRIVWRLKGEFHHSIDFDGESHFWALRHPGEAMVRIDYRSGETLKNFNILDVVNTNLDMDIFGICQGGRLVTGRDDAFHSNDVEALPVDLAKYYPSFEVGDILVSLRSVNLIFVMNPETLKVKWWRQGLTRRQHDPDWNAKGTITVFNNNMHREYSNILEIDPVTMESKVLVDGRKYDFYSSARGKHQFLPGGGVLITSTLQGWVFETDSDGNVVFEFINTYEDGENLVVSEARFLPLDFFEELPECDS